MVIQKNMQAMNASRQLGLNSVSVQKNIERLSSGYKVNRAADDAAGLAISEKMRRQIRGLSRAAVNAQDGISFCQVADGALNEMHDMIKRVKELAVQAATGTYTDEDRSYLNEEVIALAGEMNRINKSVTFNEKKVFVDLTNSAKNPYEAGDMITVELQWDMVGVDGNAAPVNETKTVGSTNANNNSSMADFIIKAAEDAIYNLQQSYSGVAAAASSSGVKIGLNIANIDGKGGTLASASLSLAANGTSAAAIYSLNIDTSDYSVTGFDNMTNAEKARLASTVAHEMTHLFMFDTLTDGMLSGKTTSFPKWFVEGMAQTSSGDNGWMSYSINPSSTDDEIKSYMSQVRSMPYGAGYLATMVLGLAASGSNTATSANIKNGLNSLLTNVANKSKTLDEMIKAKTSYDSMEDFENKFKSGDAATLALVKSVIAARGTTGDGSLFGNLSSSAADVFNPSTLTSTGSNYKIDKSSTKVANYFGVGFDIPPDSDGENADDGFDLQVGCENGNIIRVKQFDVSVSQLFHGGGLDVSTQELAQNTLDVANYADSSVSQIRAYYGAVQNRLEHTVNNLQNVVENTSVSESAIRDTDMADEMVRFSNNNIIKQAVFAVLSQANQTQQGVLTLVG